MNTDQQRQWAYVALWARAAPTLPLRTSLTATPAEPYKLEFAPSDVLRAPAVNAVALIAAVDRMRSMEVLEKPSLRIGFLRCRVLGR